MGVTMMPQEGIARIAKISDGWLSGQCGTYSVLAGTAFLLGSGSRECCQLCKLTLEEPLAMIIEISKEGRAEAIASIQRYFQENLPEPIGDLPAGLLLNFFLEEIAPAIYNRAIADAQTRMQLRISDLSGELFADEFQYWPRIEKKRKDRRR